MVKKFISNDYVISETFNECFANIVPNLKMIPSKNFQTTVQCGTENPVQNAINKFKNHPSIKLIMSKEWISETN